MKAILLSKVLTVFALWLFMSTATANIFGFEAESGITPDGVGYRVQSNPEALGGQYIDTDRRDAKAPFGDQAVFRNYSLSLPAGTYDLWGRIYCPVFFSYDPEISDDPDSNDAVFAYENDSFFVASTLGGNPAVDLDRGNGYGSTGRFDGSGNPARANVHDNWVWINFTDGTDLNGLGPSSGTVDPVASYTSAGGQVTFKLMSREGGIRHDAFAFVADSHKPTEEELDAAVEASKGTLRFTDISVDPETNNITLTWASRSGISYILNWSRDLSTDDWTEIDDNITSQGETTTFVVPAGPAENPNPAEENRLFFQVSEP